MKTHFTIGEICKLYDLGQDSLRYYERKGLLNPQRSENGYRKYTLDDIWRLNIIKSMRKLDFSVDDIKTYLDERTLHRTLDLIQHEIDFIDKQIEPLLQTKKDLKNRLKDLKRDANFTKTLPKAQVAYKDLPARTIVSFQSALKLESEVDWAFRKLEHTEESALTLFANKHRGVFINESAYQSGDYTQYEGVFFVVDDATQHPSETLEAATYATLTYYGSYLQSQKCFETLVEDIFSRGFVKIGKAIEIYKVDIYTTKLIDEYVTEIQIPVKKKD